MPPRGVGQHHPGDLRRALLDAALAILDQGKDPGLRAVAREAGVSPGAPYHHFANKDLLLAAVASEGFSSLDAALAAVSHDDPADQLSAMVFTYVRFAVEHAAHYRVMFRPGLKELGDASLDAMARQTFTRLVGAVAAVGGPDDALRRALHGWALSHGMVLLHLDGMIASLDPSTQLDGLARDVGRVVLRIARD